MRFETLRNVEINCAYRHKLIFVEFAFLLLRYVANRYTYIHVPNIIIAICKHCLLFWRAILPESLNYKESIRIMSNMERFAWQSD